MYAAHRDPSARDTRAQHASNVDRVGRTHEAEAAIARRGKGTRDPRAVGTTPTTNDTRRAAEPDRPE